MKDPKFYLVHILECIGFIEEDTRFDRERFLGNRTIRDAVMRNLQILAESTIRIPDELKERYPEIDWRRMRNFRHVAVHDYTGTDYDLVWQIIEQHLPVLKVHVERMLADLSNRPHS